MGALLGNILLWRSRRVLHLGMEMHVTRFPLLEHGVFSKCRVLAVRLISLGGAVMMATSPWPSKGQSPSTRG